MSLYTTTIDFIQLDDYSGIGGISVEYPEVEEMEAPEADSSKILPNGTKYLQSTFYWMVPGRGIRVSLSYNLTTYALTSFDCSILGAGLFGINYKGVKSSYTIGSPTFKIHLYVEMNMEYVVPIISLIGDITFPVKWEVRVEDINHGGEYMKLY